MNDKVNPTYIICLLLNIKPVIYVQSNMIILFIWFIMYVQQQQQDLKIKIK